MSVRPKVPIFVLLVSACVYLSCCGGRRDAEPFVPSGQILYLLNDTTVSTYSINPDSLVATQLEEPISLLAQPGSLIQFDPSPNDHYLYLVWSDGQNTQHLSVFATDSSGVPQLPAIQVLNADLLSQFNMHPTARFAYMLQVSTVNNQYIANIRLFSAQPDGSLKQDPFVQGTYGPSSYWPVFLYGFSADGSKLYDATMLTASSVYREHAIDLQTGALGNDSQLLSTSDESAVVIGRKVILSQYASDANYIDNYLDILPNTPNPQNPLIHCTYAMLSFCATATNIQLDNFGQYLFMTDPATNLVHVAYVNLSAGTITDTGNALPMTSQTPGFAFSPDGTIVYAILAKDHTLHFYHFNPNTGSLLEGGIPLALMPGNGFSPAQYQ
jgi:hypothetical protein